MHSNEPNSGIPVSLDWQNRFIIAPDKENIDIMIQTLYILSPYTSTKGKIINLPKFII